MSRHDPDVYPDDYPTEEIPTIPLPGRTPWAYLLLAASAIALLVETVAPIWLPEERALPIVETVAAIAAVIGFIQGGLAVRHHRDTV